VADISSVRTDIEWIKGDITGKNKDFTNNLKESKADIWTQADVDWLKRFFWVGIGAIVSSIGSLLILLFHIFIQK